MLTWDSLRSEKKDSSQTISRDERQLYNWILCKQWQLEYVKSVPKKWAQKIMNLLKFNYQEYEIHIPRENIRRFKERVDYFG